MAVNTGSQQCSICKRRKPFFYRPYSGERLCRTCFVKSIEQKVKSTISKYKMLDFDDRIAVAVSGGKDSVSLLHVMAKIEKDYPKASLVAVSIDEGIKGYRDEALKIASENCRRLGVEHHVISFKELYGYTLDEIVQKMQGAGGKKLTSCAYCGVLRRKALNVIARKVDADKLATAHTLDDEMQTILLNMLHGDVLRIAREKPLTDEVHPNLVRRIKPFCEIPERETALFAYVKKIKFQSIPCPYASEAMRSDIRLFLNRMEAKHVGVKFTLFNSAEKIRLAIEGLMAAKNLRECSRCGEPTPQKVCKACELLEQIKNPGSCTPIL
ncbi:MAG: TIGR00269 family protein [Candidatus Bathyarchaeota archaeon]|nr:TIGR00269 family protein [Candidatus Bathyarchaeota archaeon]MCX8176931.1 TIGR00269 family protein [Candidatus Bathyarchaeota archaeon]MDW8193382.1 TIGR00269 family protein [Nitrososphaerota archaeon]